MLAHSAREPHPLDTIDQPWREPPAYLAQQLIEWTRRLHPAILEGAYLRGAPAPHLK